VSNKLRKTISSSGSKASDSPYPQKQRKALNANESSGNKKQQFTGSTGRRSDKQEKRRKTSHDASGQLAESVGSTESVQYLKSSLKGSLKGSTVLEPAVVHEVDHDHGRKTMI
jgi:hypothetical protein